MCRNGQNVFRAMIGLGRCVAKFWRAAMRRRERSPSSPVRPLYALWRRYVSIALACVAHIHDHVRGVSSSRVNSLRAGASRAEALAEGWILLSGPVSLAALRVLLLILLPSDSFGILFVAADLEPPVVSTWGKAILLLLLPLPLLLLLLPLAKDPEPGPAR